MGSKSRGLTSKPKVRNMTIWKSQVNPSKKVVTLFCAESLDCLRPTRDVYGQVAISLHQLGDREDKDTQANSRMG